MNKQTLVYAQFLIEGGEKFTGAASFPIPNDLIDVAKWKTSCITSAILTAPGDPVDEISNQIRNTICLYSHSYTQDFPLEEFGSRFKEKHDELCAKFNLSI
jgi:hypothetical protein